MLEDVAGQEHVSRLVRVPDRRPAGVNAMTSAEATRTAARVRRGERMDMIVECMRVD
jgi:hypothetical protein